MNIILEIAVIYGGSALLATLFLYLKQPIVLAYIFAGIIFGPSLLGWVENPVHIKEFSHFGIILLMFLIGLDLNMKELVITLKKTALVTFGTSTIFVASVMLLFLAFGFPLFDALVAGLGLMFSSTVVSLKLIPTTSLHSERLGRTMISILLLQDIIAIAVILLIGSGAGGVKVIPILLIKTIFISALAYIVVKYVIFHLFRKFDVISEYIFIFSIGWCLALSEIVYLAGLSYEIGAFIAGISLAISPVSQVIAEKLKPIREFFLILFFFAIGATFDISVIPSIIIPALSLVVLLMVIKPVAFYFSFKLSHETKEASKELGIRLGQGSEFTLLVIGSALADGIILEKTSYVVQFAVIATFMISTYLVMQSYSTPITTDANKRHD